MPMRPIQVKANFQLDTSAARAQLQSLQRELSSVTNSSTMNLGMTEQISKAVKQAELLKQVLREATDVSTGNFDLSRFTQAMNQNMTSIQQFKDSLASLGPSGEKAFNSLATTIASAQVPLKRTSQGVQQLMTAFGNTMRWQATSMAMHKMVGTIQQAYNYAQNLDKSLTNIAIVTGHNADYMRNFAIQANKAAQTLSASTLEYTNASLIYYQQGLSDKEVTKRAETTLKLAKVTGESASKVSQQMTAVWNNFSNGVDNLERYADVMTALGATTASSSSEIAKGLEKFASVTKTIGLSYDYAASALATVTAQTRQSADSVGTAFKTLFSRLESLNLGETLDDNVTLNKYSEALLKVGVNVMDVNGNLKDMDSILDELGGRWDHLNKAQQVALAQTVGGVRNYTSLITLMDNWEDFQTNLTTSQLAEGTLQKQADIYAKSWEAAQQRVTTAAQGIYDTLISSDFFKGFNNVLADSLNLINNVGRNLGTGGSLAGIGALIGHFSGDKIAQKIDNATLNMLGNTAYGQRQSAIAKANSFISIKDSIMNANELDTRRGDILDVMSDAWNRYGDTAYQNRSKGTISQSAMQAYYNQLVTATARGQEAMNLAVDAKTAEANAKNAEANLYGRMAGISTTSVTGQKRLSIDTTAMIKAADSFKVHKAAEQKILADYQTRLNSAESVQARAAILKEMETFANTASTKAVTLSTNKIIEEIKANDNLDVTPAAAKIFNAARAGAVQITERTINDMANAGMRGNRDAYKGKDAATVVEGARDTFGKKVNAIVQDRLATVSGQMATSTISKVSPQETNQEYFGLKGFGRWIKTSAAQKAESFKVGQYQETDENGNPIGPLKYQTQTIGEFTMQTAQTFNTVAMALESAKSSIQSFKDGTLNATQVMTTVGTSMMAIGNLSTSLFNNKQLINAFGNVAGGALPAFYGKIGGSAVNNILTTTTETGALGLTSLGAFLPIALAAGAIYGVSELSQIARAQSIESRITRANEDKIQAQSQAKEDKQRYDSFKEVINAQNASYGKLFQLQQGSSAYTSQLIASNQEARNIIDTYNLTAEKDYNIDKNGALYFSAKQVSDIEERLLQESLQSSTLAQIASSKVTQQSLYKDYSDALYWRDQIKNKSEKETTGIGENKKYLIAGGLYTEKELSDKLEETEKTINDIKLSTQADYSMALQSTLSSMDNVTDTQRLAVDVLANNYANLLKQNEQLTPDQYGTPVQTYLSFLGNIREQTRGSKGNYTDINDLRKQYEELFKTSVNLDWTQEQLASAIESKRVQDWLIDQINNNNLDASAVSKYTNYSQISINDLNKIIKSTQNDTNYDSLNLLALNKIASSQDSLAQALFNNTNISDLNFQTLAGNMQEQLKLSVEQSTNLANYINNFGTNFGDATGQAILTALTGYNAETGAFGTGFNNEFYKELQNISTSSSIASLADLEQRIGMTGNRALADSMRDLQKAMIADINDRGGLAKTLFESSDFQDTFAKLQEVFQSTGSITAQNIADLAAKNETLNGYLQATTSQTPMSGTQAVADIASLLASGAITTSDLNPAIAAFINEASGTGKGSQQEAVNEAEEARKDLSDSITDADKFYQEGGKIWYNAIKNDALLDAPLQEWFNQVLKPEDLDKINRIFTLGVGKDTNWMVNQIKTTMPEVYKMMTELQGGSGKRAGKGGGGLDTYLGYLGADDFLAQSGIKIEANGRITFPGIKEGQTFEQLYDEYMDTIHPEEQTHYMTENGMYEFVTHYLQTQGHMPAAQASFIATQFVGRSASSSLGTVYARNGILAGQDKLLEELGSGKTGAITGDALDALYELYGLGMSGLTIDEKTGQLRALTEEELKNNVSGLTGDQFRNYIATQARLQGSAIIDTNGLAESGVDTTTELVGNALRDRSYGTISGTGVGAIVDAALKYGVTAYDMQQTLPNGETFKDGLAFDYKELQDFYTNILHLPIETFNQHLPELMGELRSYSGLEGGHTGLNYQYKDIFGATHNINSADAKYWKDDGTFDAEKYANDVAESERDNEWDEYQNQRMMQEAYDNWHTAMREDGSTFSSAKDYYDYLVAEEQSRREQQAAENGVIGTEHTGAITQSQKINELKTKYGYTDEDIRQMLTSPNAEQAVNEAYEQASTKEQREAEAQAAQQAEQEAQLAQQQADRDYITQNAAAYDAWINAGGSGNVEDFKTWKTKQEDIAKEQNDKVKKEAEAAANQADADFEYRADLDRIAKEEAAAIAEAQVGTGINHNATIPEVVTDEQVENRTQWLMEHDGLSEEAARAQALEEKSEMESAAITAQNEPVTVTTNNIDATTGLTSTYGAETEPNLTKVDGWGTNSPFLADIQSLALSTKESVGDFFQGAAYLFGQLFGGTEASADYTIPGITMNGKNPFGEKTEGITDDTYNPTLGMTFGEWKAQQAQQEQQLQQAQLEQESQRQAWQNYQDALNAENDFLTENGDFVTNPENARLAAWTAAARENPDLLGALYQNALKEGYTGDQFTQMYDYQGLHGATQSALSTAVGGIFNGSSVTAQQRFDFINSAYEKAQKDISSLTPFEKQVLTMIGEIDENTGTLVEHGEEEGDAATRARNGNKVNDEGQLVDEEGNPIEMPGATQPQGGGNGGRGSEDTGTPGYGGNGNSGQGSGESFKDKVQHFFDDIAAGKVSGDAGVYINGQYYETGRDSDGGVYVKDPNTGGDINEIPGYAKGKYNTLLTYASGKEGHIAITGELGPELRVKSDGSMDVLGKTGREYAWIEPDDKIYTASQSAGILKSNKIPELKGLAKGINNFIPGYSGGVVLDGSTASDQGSSSSGGGGGGGGGRGGGGGAAAEKDLRYDPNTLKIRDILERYYTILQQIDNITRAVEKFAKVADRAWGQDRIKAIEKQTELYQQQYDAQKQYVQQINEYMGTDKNALTTMIREFVDSYNEGKEDADKLTWTGAQFDSNGVLTNYRDFVEKLVEQYNQNAEANASNKEAQYKFQEQLKDIQMYTDTLNLWESETDKLQELANQILDNSLKEITYRVEYELELNADQKRLLDFQDSFIKDDIFRVADHIANMNKEIANTADSLEKTRQGLYDYLGTLAGENMRVGETYDDVALGLATRDEKGVVNTKSYEDIDFKEVSNNLDKWLAELREKDAEGAKEVDKILQRNEEGIITNYRDVLNKINALNEQLSHNSINLLLSDAQAFFDQISDLTNNPKWTGLSTEMKDQITNYMDQFIQYIQSMGEEFKEIVESMGDSLKAFGKKIDSEIDEFDYYGDVYKSFGNIIDLTNQHMTDITSDFFKVLNSKALDNNINKIEATRRRYDLFTNTLAQVQQQYNAMVDRMNAAQGAEEKAFYQQRVDELKEQLDIANSQMESAHKDFLQSWEDALSKIQENYKDAVEQASKEFEKGFSPLFNTLALLQAQFDREKALGDLYVDNYQKIHDLNKLDRDITASINDTDNLRGKQRLRDLQKEINDLQEDGTELSEYDLDILDKKYKLELARQALEDAKDAKSMVRLARDNNGNWSYVYTANQDEVDKAEQEYEDAIRDMEQANEDYIKNIQDQILNVQQEAQQAILALQPEDFATYDDYLAAIQNIQNSMYQTLDYLRSQMNNAFGNNTWLENYVPNIIQDHGLTDNFDDTTLAGLLVNGDLDQVINNARENFENNLIAPALEAFTKYSEKQQEVYDKAQYNMATIGEEFNTEMDALTQKSEDQVNVVLNLADRIGTEFGSAMDQIVQATNDWLDKIKDVVSEYDMLLKQITELKRIDGEYVEPTKLINGDDAVDTWAEVDRFKNELIDNGTMYLITTDPTTGKEKATRFEAGSIETKDFLYNAKVAAAKQEGEIIDIGDDGVDEDEYNKVNNYLDTHDKIVWIKYKDSEGEHEKLFTSKEEWEEWYKNHKYIAPVEESGGGNTPWTTGGWTKDELSHFSGGYIDTGGYTGRWQSADTGMYTGEWPGGSIRRNGRLAWLHQKELILNAHDTENFLDAMEIVRQLDNLTNWMANGLGDLMMPRVTAESGELEQNVHIEAEFPNVTDHNEIEQAFSNLVNMASQYANRK